MDSTLGRIFVRTKFCLFQTAYRTSTFYALLHVLNMLL